MRPAPAPAPPPGSGRASRRARRRSRRPPRAVLLGSDTTPYRWFHICRVISTSSTPQVATTVPAIAQSAIGRASQEPVTTRKKVTVAPVSVTATISTARTAASRTGSGIRRLRAGSSSHSDRPRAPAMAPSSSYIPIARSPCPVPSTS
ncbi:hypothetical protein K7B10_32105 [Streptomyces flavotricini]|uniref:Uncharacterized protein n=1 Tax=Streptomyces flavotricini TaxID=66888 RepID=A0ABS8EDW3_9ACTN|nr:hypothetical protein [Streptomyces flavotricini]